MPRVLKVAAVQMDANPAPNAERLLRADRLVSQATKAGAQLVVLPEIFNTGYAYTPDNYRRAEKLDGPTAGWMKEIARRLNIHLAGSLMLLDHEDVYNALLLVAPDGRTWRYDKNYPWGWERGYFRDSNRTAIAHTDLGDFGMLICWDIAHPNLWRQYAGQVDMLLACSCPPNFSMATFTFPDGGRVTPDDMGPVMAGLRSAPQRVFVDMFRQQAAWLGVPAVNTSASGAITTDIPNGLGSFLFYLPAAPALAPYFSQADRMRATCELVGACQVVGSEGQVLARLTQAQGETFTMAEVTLADEKPRPRSPQPIPSFPLLYLIGDIALPLLVIPVYRQGLRQARGERMAPIDHSTGRWLPLAGLGAAALLGLGVMVGRRLGRRGR
ncbi:MAG: carbon-nitrogen hydrolase family protein [Thermoflexales bacterium]|nr:carbon-nitrogen hydrolase family protein [Thermoflexales bacterium]